MPNEHDERRKYLLGEVAKSEYLRDRLIVSLSSGGLGISFVSLEGWWAAAPPTFLCLLVSSWILWTVSVIAVVLSYYSSPSFLHAEIKEMDGGGSSGSGPGCASRITKRLNIISGISFIIGIVLFILFSSINIWDRAMSDGTNGGRDDRGLEYVPPAPKQDQPPAQQPPPQAPPPPPKGSE